MWPPADVDHIFKYHCASIANLKFAVSCFAPVHSTWNATATRLTSYMFFKLPYELNLVCLKLQFQPSPARMAHLLRAAAKDCADFMNLEEYSKLLQAQLLLQHLRVKSPTVKLKDVLDLFVGVMDVRLSAMHPFILRGASLRVEHLALDIGDAIPFIQLQWRRSAVDHFCLGTFLHVLLQAVACRPLHMWMSGLWVPREEMYRCGITLFEPVALSTRRAPSMFCATFRTAHGYFAR